MEKKRIAWLDAAKAIGILVVLLGVWLVVTDHA